MKKHLGQPNQQDEERSQMTYADAYFFLVAAMAADGVVMRLPKYPEDFRPMEPNQQTSNQRRGD